MRGAYGFFVLVLLLTTGPNLFAQAKYLPGYLVTRSGERLEVEIMDRDWEDNPREFRYRDGSGAVKKAGIAEVAEFGYADGSLRYLRAVADIDRSSERMDRLSASSEPVFVTDTVFLEYLVDGDADLFYWEAGEVKRFFFRTGTDRPQPLISRSYIDNGHRVEQSSFRGQLRQAVNCSADDAALRDLAYRRKDLVGYFTAFNTCRGVDFQLNVRPDNPDRFRMRLRPGAEFYNGVVLTDNSFGGHERKTLMGTAGPRLGAEAELVLPYANNRWAVFGEIYYHQLRSEGEQEDVSVVTVNLRSVNVPLGVRRYIHLSPDKTLFLNAGGAFQLPWDSFLTQRTPTRFRSYDVSWNFGLFAGAGFNLGKRFQVECRYLHNNDLLQTYVTNATKLRGYTLVGAYRLR